MEKGKSILQFFGHGKQRGDVMSPMFSWVDEYGRTMRVSAYDMRGLKAKLSAHFDAKFEGVKLLQYGRRSDDKSLLDLARFLGIARVELESRRVVRVKEGAND